MQESQVHRDPKAKWGVLAPRVSREFEARREPPGQKVRRGMMVLHLQSL